MNKDKSIKDLRERNDKIESQRRDFELRLYHQQYVNEQLKQTISRLEENRKKVIEYVKNNTKWFDAEYTRIYGELCDCEGANSDRLEVLESPSNLLEILGDDKDE